MFPSDSDGHAFHTFYILIVCVLKSLQVVVGEHWHLDDTNPDTHFQ